MTTRRLALSALAAAALLSACGGGGSGDGLQPFTLTGVAATGAAVANRTLTAKCTVGPEVSTTTGANGSFTLNLTAHALPCLLQVDSGSQGRLHAVATNPGRVNLTPVTELITARALRANPATVYASLTGQQAATLGTQLGGATTAVVDEVQRLMGRTPAGDPMTQAFAIGDAEDKALDALVASLARANTPLATLTTAAAAGNSVLAAMPAEEARGQDTDPYTVIASDASATTFAALPAAAGDTVDVTTTQRFAGTLPGYDNNPRSPLAAYRIEVPANWNGELVMYAHGYAGEGPDLRAVNASIRRHLINNGYAWAASSYSKNSYDVRAGVEDTNKLALAFSQITGKAAPARTYIMGHSMGGHITGAALEEETLATAKHKVRYAGGVPMCGVMGDAELFNTFAAAGLAALQLTGVNASLPAALTERQRYQMLLAASANPQSVALPVHQALFNNFPSTGFTPRPGVGAQYASVLENLTGGDRPLFDLGLSFGGSYTGGMYTSFGLDGSLTGMATRYGLDTRSIVYKIDGDAAASAALNAAVPRVSPDTDANPLRRDGLRWVPVVAGKPYAPAVSIHTLGDIFVPFSMQQVYRQRLNAAGTTYANRVVHRAIRGASHCDFTNAEMAEAFDDMVKWVKQNTKPAGDDVMTAATVAAPTYGCGFTRNTLHPVDEATGTTRTLRGLIAQMGQNCPAP